MPFLLPCVAFIFSLKNGIVCVFVCYALKCDCWLGWFYVASDVHVQDMLLGELRFFLPWAAFRKPDSNERSEHIPALTPTAEKECDQAAK